MPKTYTSLHYHLVFSTKNRERLIAPAIEKRLWEFIAGIATQNRMHPHRVGGVDDHIHVAVTCPATIAVSKVAQLLKGNSSKWIHETFPKLRGFAWQDGYGAFTISRSSLPKVESYIAHQRKHHQAQSYEDEFRQLLVKHGVAFDPRFLID
jgi:REP element-mobilizing transposase RayT